MNRDERLMEYARLLAKANAFARLTGSSDPDEIYDEHIVDCIAAATWLPEHDTVCDVGTGGGLPGLVWAVLRPDLTFVLLDSVSRKTIQVEKMAAALGLANVRTICSRSEEFAHRNREAFGLASARAVAPLGILAEYLSPLVRVGGNALAFKGPRVGEEIEEVASHGADWGILGLGTPRVFPYASSKEARCCVVWEKIRPCPEDFPRRAGRAEKRPWYVS